jgi:hypothetical protein
MGVAACQHAKTAGSEQQAFDVLQFLVMGLRFASKKFSQPSTV